MKTSVIEAEIRQLLTSEFSGGAKFTELLVRIIEKYDCLSVDWIDFAKRLERIVEDMDGVGIVEYAWPMSPEVSRTKLFIYLKP